MFANTLNFFTNAIYLRFEVYCMVFSAAIISVINVPLQCSMLKIHLTASFITIIITKLHSAIYSMKSAVNVKFKKIL